ncbi:hypothetical protein [uncultured Nocardioides sp.]|uniref:hypothetical protein n=1 Tax=uncultured Nocardioides sp. TaxID=198441 RepID=UPI00262C2B2A|nr:hypothetical protein [uncultured Nocardioides sp.]
MNLGLWGAGIGLGVGVGLLLVLARLRVVGRPQLATRVLPYVRDLPQVGRTPALRVASASPTSAAAGVFGPVLRGAADAVERVLGGATSVRRRLERAGIDKTVHDFRVEQVVWDWCRSASRPWSASWPPCATRAAPSVP